MIKLCSLRPLCNQKGSLLIHVLFIAAFLGIVSTQFVRNFNHLFLSFKTQNINFEKQQIKNQLKMMINKQSVCTKALEGQSVGVDNKLFIRHPDFKIDISSGNKFSLIEISEVNIEEINNVSGSLYKGKLNIILKKSSSNPPVRSGIISSNLYYELNTNNEILSCYGENSLVAYCQQWSGSYTETNGCDLKDNIRKTTCLSLNGNWSNGNCTLQ